MTGIAESVGTDIGALHEAIVTKIAAAFPDLDQVGDYEIGRKGLELPAILIEMDGFEAVPEEDPGNDQLALQVRFVARCIIGFRTPGAKREVRKLACALAVFVHNQQWELPCQPAEVLQGMPDAFDPNLDQCEVWSVEWQQVVLVGTSNWKRGDVVSEVLLGYEPETGPENVEQYQAVG